MKEIRENKETPIHTVEEKKKQNGRMKKSENSSAKGATPRQKNDKTMKKKPCSFCGYSHEPKKEKCPAYGKKCDFCHGRNHFKSRCKKINALERCDNSDREEDEFWLSIVQAEKRSQVTATMTVNEKNVKFQVDTGAEINTINQKFVRKTQVKKRNTKLRMWNKSIVHSIGEAELKVTNPMNGKTYEVTFVIVPNEFQSLLGLKTVQALGLVTINSENFIRQVTRDLGDLGEVKLKIDKNASPKALLAWNIPIAIKDQVKAELDNLQERGIIVPVTEPTEWVNQMAVVRKGNGKIRICIDPQPLNKALIRERYKLPTFEDILPELSQAKVFTKLDVKEAFWHVRLDHESSLLTTMITPYGRYRWMKLPFGLSVSSEIFQRRLQESLKGLEGIFTIADDIIVVGCGNTYDEAKKDNENKLQKLYKRCEDQNIILNEEKTDMGQSIVFHGHVITDKGILPDTSKVEAILNMPRPDDVTGVRRFCGLVQYMARFLPHMAETLQPLRNLTRKATKWCWSQDCEKSFQAIKEQLTKAPVLSYFDSNEEIVVQVDSSKDGLGAVLLQNGQPVEYASRSLSDSEKKWAQIEKEALAVLYGLEKFDQYTFGRKVTVQNDHKPLENILKKPLSQAPKRLQDIIMKLLRYDIDFHKGSELIIADTLSRAFDPKKNEATDTRARILSVEIFEEFPDERIKEIQKATEEDYTLYKLREVILEGWPEKETLANDLKQYFSLRDTLSVESGIILKGEAVLIPKKLRKDILKKLHSSHLGYESLCRRARGTVFWLGMYNDIKETVKNCQHCEQRKPRNQRETLKQHSDGKRPWDKIGTDLFMIGNRNYLVVVDYYTNFIEIDYLSATSSKVVVEKLKKQFCRFGIPRQIVSDGGPQYTSSEFREFVKEWGISHHITSPGHPNSNGKAESGVKIIKNLMIKCAESGTDQYEALLEQRNTPRQDTGLSPAEMLFGWKARTKLPSFRPTIRISNKREKRKISVKHSYDRKSKNLPKVRKDQSVYFQHKPKELWQKGKVIDMTDRNYQIQSEKGVEYQRNREHIRPTSIEFNNRDVSPPRVEPLPDNQTMPSTNPKQAVEQPAVPTRPKRNVKQPAYLKDYVTK